MRIRIGIFQGSNSFFFCYSFLHAFRLISSGAFTGILSFFFYISRTYSRGFASIAPRVHVGFSVYPRIYLNISTGHFSGVFTYFPKRFIPKDLSKISSRDYFKGVTRIVPAISTKAFPRVAACFFKMFCCRSSSKDFYSIFFSNFFKKFPWAFFWSFTQDFSWSFSRNFSTSFSWDNSVRFSQDFSRGSFRNCP